MITPLIEKTIIAKCRAICEIFRLEQVYLAEIAGPRRHYLAGFGRSSQSNPGQLHLSDKVALFWHGALPSEAQHICKRFFYLLTECLEEELTATEAQQSTTSVPLRQEKN